MKKVIMVRTILRKYMDNATMSSMPPIYLNLTVHENDEQMRKYLATLNNTNYNSAAAAANANYTAPIALLECSEAASSCRDGWFADASIEYGKLVHVYVAFAICCFGTIANLLNIAVLTRKDMACAPINRILTGIAVADMMIMVEYIPFGYYYYILLPGKMNFPYWGAVYMLAHMHFTQIMHTISICLTLTLAIWRYLAIGYPDQNHRLCSESRCTLGISLSYLLPILLCLPTYFTFEIQASIITEDGEDYILYHVGLSAIAQGYNYLVINFWLYAVIIKLLPCCILTAISWWLIKTLFVAKKRKQVLRGYNASMIVEAAPAASTSSGAVRPTKAERRADRTTKMLVAVVLLFLITEFPQGCFGLLIGLKGNCFFILCYHRFGEIMDLLALLNGSINFILYCWMNRMFRITFGQLFKARILKQWAPPANSEIYTTINHTLDTKV